MSRKIDFDLRRIKSQASMMSHVKGKSECNTVIIILHTRYLWMECTLGIYVVITDRSWFTFHVLQLWTWLTFDLSKVEI